MPETATQVKYRLKDEFKQDDFYKNGIVFINRREVKSRIDVTEILPSVRNKEYSVIVNTGKAAMDVMMTDIHTNTTVKTHFYHTTIKQIAAYNYSLVHQALRRIDIFKFSTLKSYYPNLTSMREFITSGDYLGNVRICIESRDETLTPETYFKACVYVLSKIGGEISSIQ